MLSGPIKSFEFIVQNSGPEPLSVDAQKRPMLIGIARTFTIAENGDASNQNKSCGCH